MTYPKTYADDAQELAINCIHHAIDISEGMRIFEDRDEKSLEQLSCEELSKHIRSMRKWQTQIDGVLKAASIIVSSISHPLYNERQNNE